MTYFELSPLLWAVGTVAVAGILGLFSLDFMQVRGLFSRTTITTTNYHGFKKGDKVQFYGKDNNYRVVSSTSTTLTLVSDDDLIEKLAASVLKKMKKN